MSLKPLLSFSTGELDPVLHDSVTLEKFKKGLATARNVTISKTGSILSRFSRAHFKAAKNSGEAIKLFSPPNSGILTEWGNLYVRVYDFDGNLLADVAHPYTEDQLDDMNFVATGEFIYVYVTGEFVRRFDLVGYTFTLSPFVLDLTVTSPGATSVVITPAGAPSGYRVDYAIATVYKGEEYIHYDLTSLGTYNKPIGAGQSNTLSVNIAGVSTDIYSLTEIRLYRRPNGGGAFGFLGATNNFSVSGSDVICSFIDLGGDADFTNGTISSVTKTGEGAIGLDRIECKTGVVYQQRMLVISDTDEEGIIASRPGFKNNFYRDFPYDSDSALNFKSGSTGNAKVLRMIDNDGLIVFTAVGVYVNLGLLNIDNVGLTKKGSWVINEKIPPLAVPGGVFFVDKATNGILQFVFNDTIGTYQSLEHSIFSNHLFTEKTVTSWAYQTGSNPYIIVTFSDGTFATFTYNFEHQMRAWTRHDSKYPIEQVEGTGIADSTFFVTNKDGDRYIEVSLPRKIPADTFESNPEADKLALNYLMDTAKTTSTLMNDSLAGSDEFVLVPVTPGDWESNLTLTCGTSALFPSPGLGDVGKIFKHFDTTDKTFVNLTVVSRTSDDEVVVKPTSEFPSDQDTGFRLYETFISISGLAHLEGEEVAVVVDGGVVGSPNNDQENYETFIVTGGAITLDEEDRGAIIIVGRPVVADTKTLNISTAEQKPTLIESLTVNKLYIRVHKTRGLFVSNIFPEEKVCEKDGSSVAGMEDMDLYYVPNGCDILVNKYKEPVSKRIEKTIPGTWKTNGQVSIRQVDPLHFEILSIIPDAEVLWRTDK